MPYSNVTELFGKNPGANTQTRTTVTPEGHLNTDGQLVDVNGLPLDVDPVTRALTTISYAHHEIHEGDSFLSHSMGDITNGAVVDYSVITPNTTKWAHIVIEVTSEAEMQIEIYEASVLSNNGTPLIAYNKNRNSLTAATSIVNITPTVGSTGAVNIFADIFGSGKTEGGGSRGIEEFVLKTNTKYLIRLTNRTTSNNWYSIHFNWYEHVSLT